MSVSNPSAQDLGSRRRTIPDSGTRAPPSGDPRWVSSNRCASTLVAMASGRAATARVVVNREIPERVPVKPQGSILVIVRVVWSDGVEEWRAARAIRWTATHVMVAWKDDDSDPRSERFEWLRAVDVCRTVGWLMPPPFERVDQQAAPQAGADRERPCQPLAHERQQRAAGRAIPTLVGDPAQQAEQLGVVPDARPLRRAGGLGQAHRRLQKSSDSGDTAR